MKSVQKKFVEAMQSHNLTLALAESMTCGLAAAKLSSCKGVSDVLVGSMVCYTPDFKHKVLQVQQCTIDTHTCESMEVTEELARNLIKLVPADVHVAITGLASPGGSETKEKPVGTVFVCIAHQDKVHKIRKVFQGSPLEVKQQACLLVYESVMSKILKI
ncbi:MAG TPA: CinA family protein [Cytophagales bacterium]|nr:CinA family protein [Cytophagales bacterium]